ncbi:MAG: 30S ribosomal protein S20 [Bifidobacteriaceae bacterium]|jgi:small subunit ribosomal protein S20|nr:30S ribosomal protein S20 [Bifidobacteriaceae bacterium]
MPNIKSQKKRVLTNEKARLRNAAYKSELRTEIKKVNTALASGDKEAAATTLKNASRKLDKAVSKGVIPKKQASNKKSGLAVKVAAL